jgi:uncharacterized protein (DUF885 family)
MKNLLTYSLLVLLFLAGCKSAPESKNEKAVNLDGSFYAVAEHFIQGYLAWRPHVATYLGIHDYDGKITDYRLESINHELARLKQFKDQVEKISADSLSQNAAMDRDILLSGINQEIFNIETMSTYIRNPMAYANAFNLNIYIQRDFAPLEERMRHIINIQNEAPKVFAAARYNLFDSVPKPYIETAILIARGAADFMDNDLTKALKAVTVDSLQQAFKKSNKLATTELRNFANYLQNEKLRKGTNSYHIGDYNFQQMLIANEMLTTTPQEILAMGMRELKREQELFAAVAKKIDPTKTAIEVLKQLKKEHPTAENLIPESRKNLESIRQFLIDKKIVTLPSEVRVKLEETPSFARATSTASMDTPGPFEQKATQAFYFITPVEKNWSAKQKEEWLTQFTYYVTDIISIHEAYPGHYVQFLHLNASNASKIKKMFGSYAFVEGWAHYTEQMMIEEGFGAKDSISAAKYHLAQLDESLLRYCRLVVAIKTHCEVMTLEDATKFFQDNCYYEYKPAYQEALRGTFDPGYLSYTLGKLQILKLREDYKKQEGPNYSLQKFHDLVLDNGMPPIELLRKVILKDTTKTSI